MIEHTAASRILHSNDDLSVNFVWDLPSGSLEARFVRRTDDYFIVYLSSQTGCNQACRFCHLTATKQVDFNQATLGDFVQQAKMVLQYYDQVLTTNKQASAQRVHFNWMARGEPLLNPTVMNDSAALFSELTQLAKLRGLTPQFNISSIMPQGVSGESLRLLLAHPQARFYYSLYSLEASFRKRWLPKAQDPLATLDLLAAIQQDTQCELALHWAFIEGENDSETTINSIAKEVARRGLKAKFNLVRYNPYSERQGRESPEEILQQRFTTLKNVFVSTSTRIVPRVGFDVKASCGMFVHPAESQA